MLGFRVFNFIFLGVGLLLLGIAIYLYRNTTVFIENSSKAAGEVVAMQASYSRTRSSGSSTTYSPVVAFRTASNESLRFTSDLSTSPPAYHVGDKVTVLYRKEAPTDAKIADFWPLWFGTVLLTGMGTIFTGIGIVILRSRAFTPPPGLEDNLRERLNKPQPPPPYTRI